MKKISKTHAPPSLREWLLANANSNNDYDSLVGHIAHKELKIQLLKEQGYLCAYTGQRITSKTCHLEHIIPQKICRNGEDVDYRNLIACFPEAGGDTSYGFGAPIKAGWWEPALFVSPLSDDCERRFSFKWSGHVCAEPENYLPAVETIKVIGLDHENLRKLRSKNISGFFGFSKHSADKPLTRKQAQQLLGKIDQKDPNGQFIEYCFVIKQLLPKYIAGLQAS
jgi:uncharacterized protein (TIGR02646 family)